MNKHIDPIAEACELYTKEEIAAFVDDWKKALAEEPPLTIPTTISILNSHDQLVDLLWLGVRRELLKAFIAMYDKPVTT